MYEGLDRCGQHLRVSTTDEGATKNERHYTIANCMLPEAQAAYKQLFENDLDASYLPSTLESNALGIVVKDYMVGLSQYLTHTGGDSALYSVSGPMGLGLNI